LTILSWGAPKDKNGPMLSRMEDYCSTGQAWNYGHAEQEATSLLPLLRTAGQTVADVLDLIRVTPEEEKLLVHSLKNSPI
jgi:hypothetical protein